MLLKSLYKLEKIFSKNLLASELDSFIRSYLIKLILLTVMERGMVLAILMTYMKISYHFTLI